jgi:hypothetical protein
MERPDYLGIKERAAEWLHKVPGVQGVGVGGKVTAGEPTGELSITVFVERKRPLADVPRDEQVPAEIEGVPTDVIEEPEIRVLQGVPGIPTGTERLDEEEYRPVRGGVEVNRVSGPLRGTLGCLCTVTGDPRRVIALTNHHIVLKQCADTPAGQNCGQPKGRESSTRSCHDIIGKLVDAQCDTKLDIGLIQLNPGMQWLAEIEGDGIVTGARTLTAADAQPGTLQVKKRGFTSELTGGVVTHVGRTGVARNHDQTVHRTFTNGIRIQANPDPETSGSTEFANDGDSGAAVRDLSGAVVGILFGAGAGIGMAFPIQDVIDFFATDAPAARRIPLAVATATSTGDVRTVPAAMAADEQPALVPISQEEARRIEDELRTSRQGAWYADLYRRHGDEAAALVHSHRRVTVVWHRSGAAELFQWLWRAFKYPDVRLPAQIQGRPVRACLEELAAALERNGSDVLTADVRRVLPVLPDVAGLTRREILERLRGSERATAGAPA